MKRIALVCCAFLVFAGFMALGIWQIERLAWKLDLIERVNQRVHLPATSPPATARWTEVNKAEDEYRHVKIKGVFLYDLETLVQASTKLGTGFWVLTPLRQADGSAVIVNRGFVPPDEADRTKRATTETVGEVDVTGLLRMTEPRGGFLRHNDPVANRWFSRDVAAIASARNVADVAPFFVDEDAPSPENVLQWPRGGLTIIAFYNNHLVYVFTWFALALMTALAAWWFVREERKPRLD